MTDDMPQGKKTVSDTEIIEAIAEHPDPFVRADEVADEFDHTRQWAHHRLNELCDSGPVTKKAGKRSAIYWLPEAVS